MQSTISTTMSTTTSTTMEQLVYNTLYKAATPVDGSTEEFATPELARDVFIARVMKELFPSFQMPSTTPAAASPAKKEKKKPKEKKADEIPLPNSPAVTAPPAATESPKEKKKRGPMTEEAKAAMKAKREAKRTATTDVDALANAVAAMTVEEKPVKTKKAKVAEDANLAKIDPTWKKHLKTVAKAQGKEVTKDVEAELLGYLNRLTKEEFAAKKAEEHVTEFLRPQTGSNAAAEPVEQKPPVDLDVVDFNGQDYFVNPETKRVYEGEGTYDDDTGAWTNYKPVGYVGMAAFAEMKLEE